MAEPLWDVIVVGAGAAGLMSSIMCRRANLSVLLLDGREKIGAKILISGGTRCNLTNQIVTEKDFNTESERTVKHVLSAFPAAQAIQFFEALGVPAVLEEGGKYFPSTHSAQTVLDAFLKELTRIDVHLETQRKVTSIESLNDQFKVSGKDFFYMGKNVVLCTGGLSYPSTGSDGSGYGMTTVFGHSLVPLSPALTPLITDDKDWQALSGITLPVKLSFSAGHKKPFICEGSFLFTHFGFSGPAALNVSRHWTRSRDKKAKLEASFLPMEKEDTFREEIIRVSALPKPSQVKTFLSAKLPGRVAETLLKKAELDPLTTMGQLKREEREKMLQAVFHCKLAVKDVMGYVKAEVTAGGVNLAEVDPRTLESKLKPGFFFAGEILDVDGRIGGFNFQWAWSSGVVAARGVSKRIHEDQKAPR